MPKVLIVIARLNVGGTAQYIGELTKGLMANGYEVLVATGFVQGAEVEDQIVNEIPTHRIESLGRKISPRNDWRAIKELKELVKIYQPDLIYSHTFKAGFISRVFKSSIPRVHAFHGHLLNEPELTGWKVKLVIFLEKLLAPRAIRLVTVGKKVAAELLAKKIGRAEQYISIAPGVKPLRLESKDKARAELGLAEEERPIVVWMARVTAVKAPQRVIEVAKAIPQAKFVLAGGGDLLPEIERHNLENLSIVGWQPATRVWAVADLAISTSENEGMPVALIEAQLAGIPVVGLDVGSVSEVIQDGSTGFVLNNFGPEFISRTRDLIDAPKMRNAMSVSAKNFASAEFKAEKMLNSHLNLFAEILKK